MRLLFFLLSFLLLSNSVWAQRPKTENKLLNQFAEYKVDTYDPQEHYLLEHPAHMDFHAKKVRLIRRLTPTLSVVALNSKEDFEGLRTPKTTLYKTNHFYKLSPTLRKRSGEGLTSYLIRVNDISAFENWMNQKGFAYKILFAYPERNVVKVQLDSDIFYKHILPAEQLLFAEKEGRKAQEETIVNHMDPGVNRLNVARYHYPYLTGEGLNISVKERAIDPSDVDLRGRLFDSGKKSESLSPHATQMATFIAGAGNLSVNSLGVVPAARLTSITYERLMPESNSFFQQYQISVQNHSYGKADTVTGQQVIENFYGIEAEAYDQSAVQNPTLLHVYSSGNIGNQPAQGGTYDGLEGYANMTGTMKLAKNVLTVGGTVASRTPSGRSSCGPAHDGRIKPELVAFGQEGTSDAAAIASGTSALMQDAYLQKYGELPASSLVKSVLIAGADDVGLAGIDHKSGYGSINAAQSLEIIENNWLHSDEITADETKELTINIPANTFNVRIAINWTDPAAVSGNLKALVNDLDMELVASNGLDIWQPWVLSTYPHLDSLALPAVRKKDHLNNTELITLSEPAAGSYTLRVKGTDLTSDNQGYHISYYIEKKEGVKWTYPTAGDPLEAREVSWLRWENRQSEAEEANLLISYNGGNFETLETITLASEYFEWMVPDSVSKVVFRMDVQGTYYDSDTVYIAPAPRVKVGFNCTEEFNLYWEPLQGAQSYKVYQLGEKYMELISEQSDTTITLDKETHPENYYAILPVFEDNIPSIRGIAYDYNYQGVGCYYKSFFALDEGESIILRLDVGTTLNVKQIYFEKKTAGQFQVLEAIEPTDALNYSFSDQNAKPGISYYQCRLELENGTNIISDPVEVLYTDRTAVIVFPNPVNASTDYLNIYSEGEGLHFELLDLKGKLITSKDIIEYDEIDINTLVQGVYVYRIYRNDMLEYTGRIVILR